MRVLHVTQGYWPAMGGTELVIQRVSEELVVTRDRAEIGIVSVHDILKVIFGEQVLG